ncbi:hypothetical protein A3C98_01650 [Candidatus Roizmanbacteria bacterium RIFCSPHIGHO2_02_FULL_37_15]|uniref:DUF2905 domain-containing protein n=1 Tax=Candidatus Roizmanbacteria bacterium RIFCSPLOWO2_01_FULL_37_16 TaxID=1802058 RepID=A0A1F7ILW6_9BACT|nr:MAG: hypothetical protein A2859_00100 [Candidatus Roizmanbacteria bacterium RIFCSPHIGHO2_01_FULL_37_16b]OGK20892.1 MAG: hypothetical protein A3C98_01650 [Candidatus Roizmanbacteria bacterium RIFCSPHIGHO2_02_FULL_37_15]OGK33773.1 MAG: hypothetical protein A3F57_00830 [Candidatus Roizmanbacteria bacterium RIFCSPHIGHO2_12_FULL_36_11]OGK44312.1 MAG: hypothetical protein A3B40_01600 [Candidatus Roizmanbacteria bacterium RIFCSPLOWO2_01_FULL_37_16]OGK57822.1 MAG: hypothetical protein A3I50_03735 [C
MGNVLIFTGILLLIFGVLFNLIQKFHLPLLPGDILIQKDNYTFYIPIVTSIIISVVLTIILNLFK